MRSLLFALAVVVPLAQELPNPDEYAAPPDAVVEAEADATPIQPCVWGFRKVGNGWVMGQRRPLNLLCVQEEGGKGK